VLWLMLEHTLRRVLVGLLIVRLLIRLDGEGSHGALLRHWVRPCDVDWQGVVDVGCLVMCDAFLIGM